MGLWFILTALDRGVRPCNGTAHEVCANHHHLSKTESSLDMAAPADIAATLAQALKAYRDATATALPSRVTNTMHVKLLMQPTRPDPHPQQNRAN